MSKNKQLSCNIISSAISVPGAPISTDQLMDDLSDVIPDMVSKMVARVGVSNRYSIVGNYSQHLASKEKRKLISGTTELAEKALRKSISKAGIDTKKICLLIAVTNTSDRRLPGLSCELMSRLPDVISRHINMINMSDQGCSALLKGFEVAQYYLEQHPDQYVAIVASEANTGYAPCLASKKEYAMLSAKDAKTTKMKHTLEAVEVCLFGDAAAAFILGKDNSCTEIGVISHQTDIKAEDIDLIHMDQAGTKIPSYSGYPEYALSVDVPDRGAEYCKKIADMVFQDGQVSVNNMDYHLIHTGSKKILTEICKKINIPPTSQSVSVSFDVLSKYANLSTVSVGVMLHQCLEEKAKGKALILSFGIGFSASGGVIDLK